MYHRRAFCLKQLKTTCPKNKKTRSRVGARYGARPPGRTPRRPARFSFFAPCFPGCVFFASFPVTNGLLTNENSQQQAPRKRTICVALVRTFSALFERKIPKSVSILCHCEAAARPWQSLSRRYGIPWRSTGARGKKESLSQKTWELLHRYAFLFFLPRFCFVSPYHISLRDDKSFRLRLPRRTQRMRPPRNDGKLAGFMKKPTSFLIGMF